MPNWCYNRLTFPTKQAYNDFITQYGKNSREFSFQWIIPEPKTADECEEKYIFHSAKEREKARIGEDSQKPWFNWYQWHIDKWDCKWDATQTSAKGFFNDKTLSIIFSSPWAPPIKVYERMAELGIDFSYTWQVEDSPDAGGGKCENGVLSTFESEIELPEWNACAIKAYNGEDKESLIIPETLETDDGVQNVAGITPFALAFMKFSALTIPQTVREIETGALMNCENLKEINFLGTKAQWDKILKGEDWNKGVPAKIVHCSDSDAPL